MNHSNWMTPDACESWHSLLYNESKNIENRRVLFAGDDFEQKYLLDIDENPLILLTLNSNTNDNQYIFIGLPIQIGTKHLEHFTFKHIFQNNLQHKVLDGFQCFWVRCKAENVSFHKHLESFNSSDSSLRYRSKYECDTILTNKYSVNKNITILRKSLFVIFSLLYKRFSLTSLE